MDKETIESFAKYRLDRAKETLNTAENIYNDGTDYTSANNRAYYAIVYSIRAVLALEEIDFKRHKDVLAYFNKQYVNTNIFPKNIGRKISQAQRVREDSDYDDEFMPTAEKTKTQIDTAKEVIELVEKYIKEKSNN